MDSLRDVTSAACAARYGYNHNRVTKIILSTLKPIRKPIQRSSDPTGWPRVARGRDSHRPSPTPPPTTTLSARSPNRTDSAGFVEKSSMPWSMTALNSQRQRGAGWPARRAPNPEVRWCDASKSRSLMARPPYRAHRQGRTGRKDHPDAPRSPPGPTAIRRCRTRSCASPPRTPHRRPPRPRSTLAPRPRCCPR